jgi:uncharacterized protein YjiS (DUF1127 family)
MRMLLGSKRRTLQIRCAHEARSVMFTIRTVPAIAGERAERPSLPAQVSSGLARILLWPARVLRARSELAALAALSDHELRDIGLTRQDLRGATALPLHESPTPFLAAVVSERRRARRGVKRF